MKMPNAIAAIEKHSTAPQRDNGRGIEKLVAILAL